MIKRYVEGEQGRRGRKRKRRRDVFTRAARIHRRNRNRNRNRNNHPPRRQTGTVRLSWPWKCLETFETRSVPRRCRPPVAWPLVAGPWSLVPVASGGGPMQHTTVLSRTDAKSCTQEPHLLVPASTYGVRSHVLAMAFPLCVRVRAHPERAGAAIIIAFSPSTEKRTRPGNKASCDGFQQEKDGDCIAR